MNDSGLSDSEDVAEEDMIQMTPGLPLKPVFQETRHLELIRGMTWQEQSWRMKERVSCCHRWITRRVVNGVTTTHHMTCLDHICPSKFLT
jgi:hypothetical protein